MAEGTFQLKVFSGRGLEVDAAVRIATVPSQVGELGFLAHHCDYVGLLSTGILNYTLSTDGSNQRCIISGGVCTFSDNVLTLLADTVDHPGALNVLIRPEDFTMLKAELDALSLLDPQWEVLSQRLARLELVKAHSA